MIQILYSSTDNISCLDLTKSKFKRMSPAFSSFQSSHKSAFIVRFLHGPYRLNSPFHPKSIQFIFVSSGPTLDQNGPLGFCTVITSRTDTLCVLQLRLGLDWCVFPVPPGAVSETLQWVLPLDVLSEEIETIHLATL